MADKKRGRHIAQEYEGDPAFYNDQIGNTQEPLKALMDKKMKDGLKDRSK